MRNNTAFTKMLSALLRRTVYHNFLSDVISHPVHELISDPNINLEINPVKVYGWMVEEKKSKGIKVEYYENIPVHVAESNEDVKTIIKGRIPQLCEETEKFLDRIFSSAGDTPYGLRFICKKISQYAKERFPQAQPIELNSLVGGFIFLR